MPVDSRADVGQAMVDGVDVGLVAGGEDDGEGDEAVFVVESEYAVYLVTWIVHFTYGSRIANSISVVDLVFHDICNVPKNSAAKMKMVASMRLPKAATAMK